MRARLVLENMNFERGGNPLDTLNIGRVDEREIKETMALFVKNHNITAKIEEYRTEVYYDNYFNEGDYKYYLGTFYDKEEDRKKYVAGMESLFGREKGTCNERVYNAIQSAYFKLEKVYTG